MKQTIHSPAGGFWDIRTHENNRTAQIQAEIDKVERALNLAKRIQSLKSSAGYQDYVKAVQDLREAAEKAMVGSDEEREVMDLRIRVRVLDDILSLMTRNEQSCQRLESRLETLYSRGRSASGPEHNLGGST